MSCSKLLLAQTKGSVCFSKRWPHKVCVSNTHTHMTDKAWQLLNHLKLPQVPGCSFPLLPNTFYLPQGQTPPSRSHRAVDLVQNTLSTGNSLEIGQEGTVWKGLHRALGISKICPISLGWELSFSQKIRSLNRCWADHYVGWSVMGN